MNKPLWIIFLLLLWPAARLLGSDFKGVADSDSVGQKSLFLDFGGGVGYGSMTDRGVSPLRYRGPAVAPLLQVSAVRPQWQWRGWVALLGAAYEDHLPPSLNFSALQGDAKMGFEALWPLRCSLPDATVLLGGAVGGHAFFNYNPDHLNASTSLHALLAPSLCGRMEWSPCRWSFFVHGQLSPIALTLSPGFAYLDNFSASNGNSSDQFLSLYRRGSQSFATLATTLGARYALRNGNALSVAYRWHYHHVQHEYHQAFHTLDLQLHFKLR